jgi:hypothetical protein
LSDEDRIDHPAVPGNVASSVEGVADPAPTPVAPSAANTPQPVPLPLPPAGTPTGSMGRKRIAMLVITAVAAVLLLCLFAGIGLNALTDASFEDTMSATGALDTRWAGNGRYAVIEYLGSGTDGTSSVIAWDSVTLKTRKVDGYRIVATEPSSTQVWLTKAVAEDADSDDETSDSSWDYSNSGDPLTDGPGSIWSWDVSRNDAPQLEATPTWEPWTGPAGITAHLGIDVSIGLWPRRITFSRNGATSVEAKLPASLGTFLPVGWSPSGRYFAICAGGLSDDSSDRIVILDARTGAVVASHTSSYDGYALPTDDGAAWDPTDDVLWFTDTSTTSAEDEEDTVTIAVYSLEPSGTLARLQNAPSAWKDASEAPVLLGTSPQGVLLGIETLDSQTVWRIGDGKAVKVGTLGEEGNVALDWNAYSATGVLERVESDSFLGSSYKAVVTDSSGKRSRTIWPTD